MNNTISLFFAGDFCSKPSTKLIRVDKDLSNLIKSSDCSIVNFEVPLNPGVQMKNQYRERFFQNDDAPEFLKDLGFSHFSLANNHAFDWEDAGYMKTKSALGENAFGAGTYDEAYKVKIVEKKGIKIGFLALSFAAYKGVFNDSYEHSGLGCAYINDLKVNHVIIESKKHVDYLFILPHDGIEYIDVPLPETIARYRDFIDYGADGVFASHPHCPQGWEEYKGKPIFYSLGNLFFNSKPTTDFHCTKPHWYEGRCVLLIIENGKVSIRVINVRNKNNLELVLDHSIESLQHNTVLCNYLKNKDAYENYLFPLLKSQYIGSELRVIDTTFHFIHLKHSIKGLWNCVLRKIKHIPDHDETLEQYLKNDLRRYRILRSINKKQNIQ